MSTSVMRILLAIQCASMVLSVVVSDVRGQGFVGGRKPSRHPVALVLVLDRGGSMAGMKLAETKKAARVAIGRLKSRDRVAVITFDTHSFVWHKLRRVGSRKMALAAVRRITSAHDWVTLTPRLQYRQSFRSGVLAGMKQLSRLPRNKTFERHVLFIADGKAQSSQKQIVKVVRRLWKTSATFHAIGLHNGIDRSLLRAMTKAGGGSVYFWNGRQKLRSYVERFMRRIGR